MQWGKWYWPIWLTVMTITLLGPEVYALCTNINNTLSVWVWNDVKYGTAVWFLTFGIWLTLGMWLTFHFFFRLFT